jgi:hypothetical protein
VTPEQLQEILQLCEATAADERGFRELPQKTTLTFYVAKDSVGLTVANVEALALRGHHAQARTTKGDLYVLSIEDVFACNIEGRAQPKSARRAGFAAE